MSVPPLDTPPDAPGSLSADSVDTTSIGLTWEAATDDDGVASYEVLRGSSVVGTSTTTSYIDRSLTPNTAYTYSVRAVDTAGHRGPPSDVLNVTTATPDLPPGAPGQLSAVATSPRTSTLTWDLANDDHGVVAYEVLRDGNVIASLTGDSYDDSGLAADTTYSYAVRAVDTAGQTGPLVSAVLTTPVLDNPPSAPDELETTATPAANRVSLSWETATDDFGIASYEVLRDGVVIADVPDGLSYVDETVQPQTSYTYAVRAVDTKGQRGPLCEELVVHTPLLVVPDTTAPTAPPTLDGVSTSPTTVELSWTASTDAVGVAQYLVRRDGSVVGIVADPSTSYVDTGLAAGSRHTYTVVAVDSAGNVSGASPQVSVRTQVIDSPPTAAGKPVASGITPSSVDLSWTAASDDLGVLSYEVLRDGALQTTTSGTTWTDTGLSETTTYVYTVRAVDAADQRGPSSTPTTVTTTAIDRPPTAPGTPTLHVLSATSVAVAWAAAGDDVGVATYDVLRDGVIAATVAGAAWTDTGLSPRSAYTYAIRATDTVGQPGPQSGTASVTTPAADQPPTAATGLAATAASSSSIGLTWTAATDDVGITGYQVLRGSSVVATVTTRSYTDTGLSAFTSYTYSVRAIDTAGQVGPASNSATATTQSAFLFSDDWTGTDGSAWSTAWSTSVSTGMVSKQSGAGLLSFDDTANAYARAQLTGLASLTDSDVLLSYRWNQTTALASVSVYLRGSGGWQNGYRPKTGYGLELTSNSGAVAVRKNVNGTTTTIRTVSGGQSVTTGKQWLRLSVSGTTIRFKIWTDGQLEPTVWKATDTDSQVTTAGQLFFSSVRGAQNAGVKTILIDDLRVTVPGP